MAFAPQTSQIYSTRQIGAVVERRPALVMTKPGKLQSSLGHSGCREVLGAVETSGKEEEKPVRFPIW